ncbi:Anuclease S(1) containing protein [Plasmodiophora brassicae]|uniref:Aspergillus nuclease S(1) n=1 Tax=Plasmodiophora brassicae TaxID=37360 RepID=A0A0G4IJ04_PLABS|nr:hypothetical protein PBRA_003987 [Plasmodiophora brassicae]
MVVLGLLAMLVITGAHGWGRDGHEITAAIAESLLNDVARRATADLLSVDGGHLADVADWADQVKRRHGWQWSSALHYANTRSWECGYTPVVDCPQHRCIAGAVHNYTARLLYPTEFPGNDPYVALKFLVHFVGDISQPLHVSFKADEGGNLEHGHFCRRRASLHEIWDDEIIKRRVRSAPFDGSRQAYVSYLIAQMGVSWTKETMDSWIACADAEDCAHKWAADSALIACKDAYTDTDGSHIANGFDLCDAYYARAAPIVDMQLVKGGVRLAHLLNNIWRGPTYPIVMTR